MLLLLNVLPKPRLCSAGFTPWQTVAFEHDGQITKQGMRSLAVAQLAPFPGAQLWDLGAGAASVLLLGC